MNKSISNLKSKERFNTVRRLSYRTSVRHKTSPHSALISDQNILILEMIKFAKSNEVHNRHYNFHRTSIHKQTKLSNVNNVN
jgi:hypothetical protein